MPPTRPTERARTEAARWRVALARDVATGAPGERLGRGTGSSLEFQDRRDYAAGDDVRHLDWRAFARTDQLLIRLYREEVLPRVELVVDVSGSMAVDDAKAELAVDLALVLGEAARAEGLEVALVAAGDAPRPLEWAAFEREGLALEGASTLADTAGATHAFLRRGAVRIVVSDFLFPHDPGGLVRGLARGAGAFALLQVLARHDAAPEVGEALRLVDAEADTALDLVLDPRTVDRYRRRLTGLTDALRGECRGLGGVLCELVADRSLEECCRDVLAPAGVLAPA